MALHLQILSRRQVVAGLVASAGLSACDDGGPTDLPAPQDTGPAEDQDIPPITSNEDHYITSCCGTPGIVGADWSCEILQGEVVLARIDLAWLESLSARDKEHTLECISAGPYNLAISNAVWSGLPLSEVFQALGVSAPSDTIELVLQSADGFSTSLPIADLDRPVWLVWRMNGEPLPAAHGYPARLLVPGRYGMKNPKWIVQMRFSDQPYIGFWESYGWSNTAEYKANALVQRPRRRSEVLAGPIRVQGMAFAGSDPVVSVQVRLDGGDWVDTTLDYNPGADIWTLYHLDMDLLPGEHTVQARCVTASGVSSLDDPEGSEGKNGYDGSMLVEFEAI